MTIAIDNMNMESQNDEAAIATDMDTESPPAADVASSENNENEEPTNNNNNNSQGVRTAATSGENFTVPASAVEPAPASLKCRLMPHGAYTVLPALFATMAWFACLSKDGCDYARVTGPIVSDITNNPNIPFIDAGFTHYREPTLNAVNGEWISNNTIPCEPYNTDVVNIDGAWSFAKLTAFLSLVFGGGGALFIWFSSCFVFQKHIWRWAGYELLVATVLQILTYTWFATSLCHGNDGQDKCVMHYGARADILACVLWAGATLFIFCKYPGEKVASPEARNAVQQPPPTGVEMANRSGERQTGTTVVPSDHEII